MQTGEAVGLVLSSVPRQYFSLACHLLVGVRFHKATGLIRVPSSLVDSWTCFVYYYGKLSCVVSSLNLLQYNFEVVCTSCQLSFSAGLKVLRPDCARNCMCVCVCTVVFSAGRYSEKSRTKCIGITIETRPDYCLKRHLRWISLSDSISKCACVCAAHHLHVSHGTRVLVLEVYVCI